MKSQAEEIKDEKMRFIKRHFHEMGTSEMPIKIWNGILRGFDERIRMYRGATR